MKMKNSQVTCILIFFISKVVASAVQNVLNDSYCCGSINTLDKTAMSSKLCTDGRSFNLFCERDSSIVEYSSDNYEYSVIRVDDWPRGRNILFTLYDNGTVRELHGLPRFCMVNVTEPGRPAKQLAVVCEVTDTDEDDDTYVHQERRTRRISVSDELLTGALIFLFVLSSILLGVTAFIYWLLPETKDVEGKCTFHMTLMQSLYYLTIMLMLLAVFAHIPGALFLFSFLETEAAIGFLMSLFLLPWLSSFAWCTVLVYHMNSRFKQNSMIDESKLLYKYMIVGYGIPALLDLLRYIHHLLIGKITLFHILLLMSLYVVVPVFLLQCVTAFYFISLQRKLWNVNPANPSHHSTTALKKWKFRLLSTAKLFILTGLPWLLLPTCNIIFSTLPSNSVSRNLLVYLEAGIVFIIASEGIFIFYILVISRKRVYQGLARKFGCTVKSAIPESEGSDLSDNENRVI